MPKNGSSGIAGSGSSRPRTGSCLLQPPLPGYGPNRQKFLRQKQILRDKLEEEDFAWITRKIVDIAGEYCDGKLVSSLEGGYDLEALSLSVSAHLSELAG